MEHTPGPWRPSLGDLIRVRAADGRVICGVHKVGKLSGGRIDEAEANARLIASAPAMRHALWAALERLFPDGEPAHGDPLWATITTALAAAEPPTHRHFPVRMDDHVSPLSIAMDRR